jgi:molecular chaperone DnaK (HSP70)
MNGRLAIDFGNANTVIAIWDDEKSQPRTVELRPYARIHRHDKDRIPLIPSVIHFPAGKSAPIIGQPVIAADSLDPTRTLRSLKRNLNMAHGRLIDDQTMTYADAANVFMSTILSEATRVFSTKNEPIALTVPVDSFEQYTKWLSEICEKHGYTNVKFIDEPAAAALSFGKRIKENDVYLIFDFGASTLDLAVVKFQANPKSVKKGKHCQILAKRAMEIGGDDIDNWIFQHILLSRKFEKNHPTIEKQKHQLLTQCRLAKEALSSQTTYEIQFENPYTKKNETLTLAQSALDDILQTKEFFYKLNQTIDRVLDLANQDFGLSKDNITGILMVGGSSLIPSVQRNLKNYFGSNRVQISQPLDAVARGAAAYIAGMDLYDHVQHDYAIYHRDPKTKQAAFETIIHRGEKYPSQKAIATKIVTADYFNQTEFELVVCEISTEPLPDQEELVALQDDITFYHEQNKQPIKYRFLNKKNPCLLKTKRAIQQGHKALEVSFFINENKQLVIDTFTFNAQGQKIPHQAQVQLVKLS